MKKLIVGGLAQGGDCRLEFYNGGGCCSCFWWHGGVQIDPKEWWDAHWIKDHIAKRVDLPGFNP